MYDRRLADLGSRLLEIQSLVRSAAREPKASLRRLRANVVATNSALLFANTVVTAVLGVVFWAVATRFYDLGAIGLTSAVISGATLIASVTNLGLTAVVVRYLPLAGAREGRLCLVATVVPGVLALSITPLLTALPALEGMGAGLRAPGLGAGLLPPLLAAITAVALVQDSIFVARRQAGRVLVRGAGGSLVRLGVLIPCAGWGAAGLVTAYTAGALVVLALGAPVWRRTPETPGPSRIAPRQLTLYGATSYVSGLFSQTPQLLYPILIATQVSHEAAGAFAFAWMVASLLMALPPSVASVLLTQLVRHPDTAPRRIAAATRTLVAVGVLLAGGLLLLLMPVMPLLLPQGAGEATAALPLLLTSTVLYGIVRMRTMVYSFRQDLRGLLILNGAVAAAAVLLPLVLLPRFGVVGLEAGWLVSQCLGVAIGLRSSGLGSRMPTSQARPRIRSLFQDRQATIPD